jgi:hypothetical protein
VATKNPLVIKSAIAILLIIVAVQAFVIWTFHYIYNPGVITDARDKRFDPKKFQFTHYSHMARNESEFNIALLKMFPPGTDKAYVEKILVKQAGATVSKNNAGRFHNPGESAYSYIWGNWQVSFVFDENNKTDTMKTGGVLHYGTDRKKEWREKINSGGGSDE